MNSSSGFVSGGLPENFDDISWLIGPVSPSGAVGNTAARLEVTEFDSGYFNDTASDGTHRQPERSTSTECRFRNSIHSPDVCVTTG